VSDVLEDFGRFTVPFLMRMYGHLLKPEWRAIDVIDHTEGTVHAVVRVKNPDAKPPKLKTQRLSPNEVLLVYTWPRQMLLNGPRGNPCKPVRFRIPNRVETRLYSLIIQRD
jgi:hypothetical protein